MAGLQTASDVPLLIRSDTSSSERRISPAWTIAQLKTRLEPITGIPPSCQRLSLKLGSEPAQDIAAADEEATRIGAWPLQAYAELHVIDTRPPGARANFTDVSSVPKYEMPVAEYEQRADTVLAWKKAQRLGRFDPAAPAQAQEQVERARRAVAERDIAVGRRCRLLPDADHRRGTVRFVGPVPEIPAGAAAAAGGDGGEGVAWVGVELDEPTGKNDGSIQEQRYFTCAPKHGVFIHPERVEVGDYPVLDEFADENEDDEF